MKHNLYLLILISITFSNCYQSSNPSQYMTLENVEFIEKFPLETYLENKTEPNLGIIGVRNFIIHDSIMIVSKKGSTNLFSIFSLPNFYHLGSFLTQGEGPLEFIQPPSVNREMKLVYEYEQLFAYIYDFQKGKLIKVNIDRLIKENNVDITEEINDLPRFIFDFIIVSNTRYFCKELNETQTKQLRYMLTTDNMRDTTSTMKRLNKVQLRQDEDFNILGASTKMEYAKGIIVEMPIGLNYINMYALDDSWGKTICIGDALDDIEKIQDKKRWDRVYTFADLRIYPSFWGVVHINEDEMTYQTKRKKLPSILLFDWQGKPLAKLKLNHFITSFEIDLKNGHIYTFDVHSDELFKYDINDILSKIDNL